MTSEFIFSPFQTSSFYSSNLVSSFSLLLSSLVLSFFFYSNFFSIRDTCAACRLNNDRYWFRVLPDRSRIFSIIRTSFAESFVRIWILQKNSHSTVTTRATSSSSSAARNDIKHHWWWYSFSSSLASLFQIQWKIVNSRIFDKNISRNFYFYILVVSKRSIRWEKKN